jgi:hypothetical protein
VFNTTYFQVLYVNKYSHSVQQEVFLMGRFIYTKYWGLLYGEHCGKIIYKKIFGNT